MEEHRAAREAFAHMPGGTAKDAYKAILDAAAAKREEAEAKVAEERRDSALRATGWGATAGGEILKLLGLQFLGSLLTALGKGLGERGGWK